MLKFFNFKKLADYFFNMKKNISTFSLKNPASILQSFMPQIKIGIIFAMLAAIIVVLVFITDSIIPDKKNSFHEVVMPQQSIDYDIYPEDFESRKFVRHVPYALRYKDINEQNLIEWLEQRNSIFCEAQYFDIIIEVSKEFDLNPILLFSIIGQEQNFVPIATKHIDKIINNPFNVYHSWEDYNTNLREATEIASRTIINLLYGTPPSADPIKWLNTRGNQGGYAEDPEWHKGVSYFMEVLSEVAKK